MGLLKGPHYTNILVIMSVQEIIQERNHPMEGGEDNSISEKKLIPQISHCRERDNRKEIPAKLITRQKALCLAYIKE